MKAHHLKFYAAFNTGVNSQKQLASETAAAQTARGCINQTLKPALSVNFGDTSLIYQTKNGSARLSKLPLVLSRWLLLTSPIWLIFVEILD
jgi:hypothetical protein